MANTDSAVPVLCISREEELRELHEYLRRAISTRVPQFILIEGDYGLGKTTLVNRFLSEAAEKYSAEKLMVGVGDCTMEDDRGGLEPFRELFLSLTEKGLQWQINAKKLAEFIAEVAPAWLDVAGFGIPGALKTTYDEVRKLAKPTETVFSQESIYGQFTNSLAKLTEKRPALLFVDNLHWADEGSVRLLFHMKTHLKDCPVLLVVTYRPFRGIGDEQRRALLGEVEANLQREGAHKMELTRCIDTAEYVRRRYPHNHLPGELIERVDRRTGGHPFFLDQVFHNWEDQGLIHTVPAADNTPVWVLKAGVQVGEIELPEKLEAVLTERIRRLSDELRGVLRHASVEGEEFTAQTLITLTRLETLKAFDDLRQLREQHALIDQRGTQQLGFVLFDLYGFAHRFFREHVYNHMLEPGERREMHRLVGETLEKLCEDDLGPVAAQLARHFQEAKVPNKAARFAIMAAEAEQARFLWTEARRWCEFGLAALQDYPESPAINRLRCDLYAALATTNYRYGDFNAAEEAADSALELAAELELPAEKFADIYFYSAINADELGDYERMLDHARRGLAILAGAGITQGVLLLQLRDSEALALGRNGQSQQGIDSLTEALAAAEALPRKKALDKAVGEAYNDLAILYGNVNHFDLSIPAYQKGLEVLDRVNHVEMLLIVLTNMADDLNILRRFDETLPYLNRAHEIVRQIGALDSDGYVRSVRGYTYLMLGRVSEAVEDLTQAAELLERTGTVYGVFGAMADLALAYLAQGEQTRALEQARRAVEAAQRVDRAYSQAYTLQCLARIEGACGEYAPSAEHFEGALKILEDEDEEQRDIAIVQRCYAEMLLQQGERERAVPLLEQSLGTLEAINLEAEAALSRAALEKARQG